MGALKIWDGTSWQFLADGVKAATRQRGYIEATATQTLAVGTNNIAFTGHGSPRDVAEGVTLNSAGFTITEAGWYDLKFTPFFNTASANTYILSTYILVNGTSIAASAGANCTWSGYLNVGDALTYQVYTGTAMSALALTSASVKIDRSGTTWAGMGPSNAVVCTSSTRPAVPAVGLEIFETDTLNKMIWNGSAWQFVSGDDTGWIAPTLLNSWTPYGGSYEVPGYRRKNGVVYLKGLLTPPASVNTNILILPAGFRPIGVGTNTQIFTVNTNPITGAASAGTAHTHVESSTSARLQIQGSNGAIWPGITGYTGHLSLSGVSFLAEQ